MAFTGETYQLVDGDSVNGVPATGGTAAWNKKQLAMGGVLGLVLGVGAGVLSAEPALLPAALAPGVHTTSC